ncbi:MAG: nodulation protein NfeD [Thermodesulfovibrionales bacterium]
MRKISAALILSAILLLAVSATLSSEGRPRVSVIRVEGVINPVTSEFIRKSIALAHEANAEALVIELDTPGGLDSSMRDIVKEIMASGVPVAVYVAPSGARAASAGAFITLAAHVAAMAPGTNIGAAHPVGVGGRLDKTQSEKAENDAAAYIKSIAEKTGRNQKWAEDAVRKSVSATEGEAVKSGIVDLVSDDLASLLAAIDGRKITTAHGEKILRTRGAETERRDMTLRQKILSFITDPNVAYMLMLLGFYGIFFEFTNPGTIFPGVLGSICLILAFYSFQTLSVNYAGMLLIILSLVLFILEIKIISHGILTIGGIVAMVIGSLMLFDTPGSFMRLSLALVLPAAIATALFFTFVIGLAYRALKQKPISGSEGMVGIEGAASTDITPAGGMVLLHGEVWSAWSDTPIAQGDRIVVESISGLRLKVRKPDTQP